jgi:RNA recognition motif-containing protein
MTQDQLIRLLSAAGTVVSAHLPSDRETGRPRGFAFVEFSTEAEAAEAIRMFNEREVEGRRLRLNPAEERPPRRTDGFQPRRPAGPPSGFPPSFGADRPPREKQFRSKGSRRGIRGRKRSL